MTKIKSPRLNTVIGMVKRIRMGFKTAFAIPRMTATTIAVKNPSTLTPGRTYEAIHTARPFIKALTTISTDISYMSRNSKIKA